MTFTISPNTTAAAFQAAFAEQLPNLKPVFFRHHNAGDMWSGFMVLNNQVSLSELSGRSLQYTEPFTISPNMTVADFENTMQARYGLAVRIFRKQHGDWVETTDSRNLDLEGQNERGTLSNPLLNELVF